MASNIFEEQIKISVNGLDVVSSNVLGLFDIQKK